MAIQFNDENLQQAIETGQPVVVDCWAEWCGPCKSLAPIVEELAAEYEGKVVIGKYDIEQDGDFPMDNGVHSIPTVLFFKNGQRVDKHKHVGFAAKDTLKAKIDALL
ncbi:thioredoxin [Sodaliphilus sp.]|uniref:thioredoxin n=1 Tax=Sodaliphilus sp. TaxID=2815818 RepID=UPI00388F8B0C